MEYGLYIIEAAGTTTLVPTKSQTSIIGHITGTVKSISVCNGSASNAATVRLFLDDGTNETSIVESLVIPAGVTLLLNEDLSFNNSILSMQLTVAGTSPNINVVVK
jgi:hypothetical protein